MNRTRRRTSPLAAGAALAVAALAVPIVSLSTSATAAPRAQAQRAAGVQMRVVDVTPTAPQPSPKKRPLTVTLDLVNTTTTSLRGVVVTGVRGDPVENQQALDDAIGDDTPPVTGNDIPSAGAVRIDLPADGTPHRVSFTTSIGIPLGSGICQCAQHAVYPLYFTARSSGVDGRRLGSVETFVPSFYDAPEPVRVSWVWPLIDRPHRLTDDTVFSDDSLATIVGPGGRLDRALTVVERTADTVPLTLVVDPELLDELAVMATGKYTVDTGAPGTSPVPGTGQLAADTWLQRFRALLQSHPGLQVQLTPYADPDVQSLALQNLGWQTGMPPDMLSRVVDALAGRAPESTLSWPAGGAYTAKGLGALVQQGIRSVILPANAVSPHDGADGSVPVGTARLRSNQHTVAVATTSAPVQGYAAAVMARRGDGVGQLPELLAEIAIRAAQDPTSSHTLVVTPPRYVDPDVAAAVRAIQETSRSTFAVPAPLTAALGPNRLPAARSRLAPFPSSAPTLPSQTTASAADVSGKLPAINSLLAQGGKQAAALIAALPVGLQRIETSYWLAHPALAAAPADALVKQVDAFTSGVSIVPPHSGYYTLGSSTSPLPVTVENALHFPVQIRLRVTTVNGLPGFTAHDIGTQQIDAGARRTLHLPTSILRSGRIQIQAQLLTPRKQALGEPVPLSVHSTAFGTIGVIITITGGAVLLLALLVRAGRRLRERSRNQDPPARPAWVDPPAEVPEPTT